VSITISSSTTSALGIASISLSTVAGAGSAVALIDTAINSVTSNRSSMGAYQNQLNAVITNLANTSMNLSAARSRILDTDYAKETTNLAKAQIIQQALSQVVHGLIHQLAQAQQMPTRQVTVVHMLLTSTQQVELHLQQTMECFQSTTWVLV